jgi:uncharacterized membrane protein YGL010W
LAAGKNWGSIAEPVLDGRAVDYDGNAQYETNPKAVAKHDFMAGMIVMAGVVLVTGMLLIFAMSFVTGMFIMFVMFRLWCRQFTDPAASAVISMVAIS